MSTKPKWTAPPWQIRPDDVDPEIMSLVVAGGKVIATLNRKHGDANARLIALAPEMYLLLRRYMIIRRERMIYAGEFSFNGYACRACGTDWGGPADATKDEFHRSGCFFSRVHAL